MMCPNFIYWILQVLKDSKVSKSLINQGLLIRFLNRNGNCYSHTDHGVVTGADQTHHLYASGALAIASGWVALAPKPCRISLFDIFALQNLYSLNTSFSVLLNALYRVSMCLQTGRSNCLRNCYDIKARMFFRTLTERFPYAS